MSGNNNSFSSLVIRYRWLVIVCTILLVAAAAGGVTKLRFTNDYRYFFSKENPQLKAFEELQDTYTKNDNVLFAIAPKNRNVFTPETLAIVEDLTEASWQIPYSIRVDSITNYQHTRADEDDLIVGDLVSNAASLTEKDLKKIKSIALSEPLLVKRLISPASHVTGVNITINLPGKSLGEVPEVAAFVRAMADDIREKHPEVEVYLTGMVMMNDAFAAASQEDMITIVPVMFLVILAVMWLLIRSVSGALATMVIISMSTLTAMGLSGWYGIMLSGPSVMAPTIISTLAVADCVHILISMRHEMGRGSTKIEAIKESLRINMQPVFLTSLTTAIGFLSMNSSDAPPFHDLGNIVAAGVISAFFYSIFFLPALISLLPVPERYSNEGTEKSGMTMDSFSNFIITNQKAVHWCMVLFIIILISGLGRIELNDNFVEYFDDRYSFRTDTDFINENLTGIYRIEYSLGAGGKGMISDPEYLAKMDEFADWYRQQEDVLHISVLTDTMKRLNRNMHGDDDAFYKLPEQQDLAAQYLLLYELSLPFGLDLNNQINVDKSATRFIVILRSDMTTREILSLEAHTQKWFRDNAPPAFGVDGSSTSIMFSHIAKRNIKSMFLGTGLALVLISGILIAALRNFKIGLISLIPNLVPAFMAFGLWSILFKYVGLSVSVVAAMSLGIVVDDTVHFLSKYLRARREYSMDAEEAVRFSFRTVGTALWVTSFVLIAGFSVLSLSGYALNSDMGILTAIAILMALLADFLFLPVLLMRLDKEKK